MLMLACPKCGQSSQDRSIRYCPRCKIPLISFPLLDEARSTLDLGEGRSFRHPQLHYHTEPNLHLNELYRELLNGEDVLEAFEDQLEQLGEIFETFIEERIRPVADSLSGEREIEAVEELVYLFGTGVRLFYQGHDQILQALDGDSVDGLEKGMKELTDGQDYLYFGLELADELFQKLTGE